MTAAAKTPSQRGRANRNKGHQAERDLCKWLRVNGFPGAERAVRTGFRTLDRTSADPGDVTGTPGVVWSVKDCAVEQLVAWMAELDRMDDRDQPGGEPPVRLLVHKRRGHADPARWWCWLTLPNLHSLIAVPNGYDHPPLPVRMELGHVVPLLRGAGYGSEVAA